MYTHTHTYAHKATQGGKNSPLQETVLEQLESICKNKNNKRMSSHFKLHIKINSITNLNVYPQTIKLL